MSFVNGNHSTIIGDLTFSGLKRGTIITDSEGNNRVINFDKELKEGEKNFFSKGEILRNVTYVTNDKAVEDKKILKGLDENGNVIEVKPGETIKYLKLTSDYKLPTEYLKLRGNLKDSVLDIDNTLFSITELVKVDNKFMTNGKVTEGTVIIGSGAGVEGGAHYATAIGTYSKVTEDSVGSIALGSFFPLQIINLLISILGKMVKY